MLCNIWCSVMSTVALVRLCRSYSMYSAVPRVTSLVVFSSRCARAPPASTAPTAAPTVAWPGRSVTLFFYFFVCAFGEWAKFILIFFFNSNKLALDCQKNDSIRNATKKPRGHDTSCLSVVCHTIGATNDLYRQNDLILFYHIDMKLNCTELIVRWSFLHVCCMSSAHFTATS